jgi:hypothetical protein
MVATGHASDTRYLERLWDSISGCGNGLPKAFDQFIAGAVFGAFVPTGCADCNAMIHQALRLSDGRRKNHVVGGTTALPSYAPDQAPRLHRVETPVRDTHR